MKTNPKANRNRSSNANQSRAPLNRNKAPVNQRRSTGLAGVKSRIGKPKIDLRLVLTKKVRTPTKTATTSTATSSNVKSRLGLQSATAKLEAKREAREQLKLIQNKKTGVKDAKTPNNQLNKAVSSAVSKTRQDIRNQPQTRKPANSTPIRQDRSLNNRTLNTRRTLDRSDFRSRNDRNSGGYKSLTTQPIIIPQYIPTSQPIIYQQPSHHSTYDNAPNRYINRSEANSAPEVMSSAGNSVLVSNLSPKITEDEVAELFGDIGPLMNVQIINSTTALVTYFASQHASKAIKVYNYRLLDGIAMNCTILPSTSASTQQSSSQQPLYSGRMYSDSIPATRSNLRANYHYGL